MGKLHSQLALFGSIDELVVERDDPETTATVEKFLPGTTGPRQRGWYGELKELMNRHSITGDPVHFPSREEALADLTSRPPLSNRAILDILGDTDDIEISSGGLPDAPRYRRGFTAAELAEFCGPAGLDEPDNDDVLPTSVLARAIYAGTVLSRIGVDDPVAQRPTPAVTARWGDATVLELHRRGFPVADGPLTRLMAMAAPPMSVGSLRLRYSDCDADAMFIEPQLKYLGEILTRGPALKKVLSESELLAPGRRGWADLMREQRRYKLVRDDIADYPAPCVGQLRTINGMLCTVVSTEVCDRNHTLAQLGDIVDPVNWKQTLPSFFCAMEAQSPTTTDAGWNRVLEVVSTECSEYRLKTALKYWNARRTGNGLLVNYDLDDRRDGDSGMVEVDSGYIWITEAAGGGVRIKTSKTLHIRGLSPTATAALACFSGWAQVGIDMMINGADRPNMGLCKFVESDASAASALRASSRAPKTNTSASAIPDGDMPDLPPNFRQDMMDDGVEQMKHYIDTTADLTKDFVRRWRDGLSEQDISEFGNAFGTKMTALAVASFESVISNFRPKTPPAPADADTED